MKANTGELGLKMAALASAALAASIAAGCASTPTLQHMSATLVTAAPPASAARNIAWAS
jgi:hypothetical protein